MFKDNVLSVAEILVFLVFGIVCIATIVSRPIESQSYLCHCAVISGSNGAC